MLDNKVKAYALKLFEALENRQAINPLTTDDPDFDVKIAYDVQLENVKRKLDSGDVISGKKIGLTSLPMQEMFGVNEPDYGHLFASMDCKDNKIDSSKLLQPKIEAELAFVLKSDLTGGNITVEDVDEATDYIVAAFEIVDSRIADWKIKLPDTVADNASSGCYVLGKTKVEPKTKDLTSCFMSLYKEVNGIYELVNEGYGSAVLDDPRIAVAWLANKLWEFGVPLKANEVILSGAFSAASQAFKGDKFKAEFDYFGILEAEFV